MSQRLIKVSILCLCVSFSSLILSVRADENLREDGRYLFVQNAEKAIITSKGKGNAYTLTLKNVSPFLIYLSERPTRLSGQIALEKFLNNWKKGSNSFQKDPPNAVLNSVNTRLFLSDEHSQYAFELSNPIYDAKSNVLKYTAKAIKGSPTFKTNEIQLEHAFLFIDGNVCISCWGGGD